MGLRSWSNRTIVRLQASGWGGAKESLYELYNGAWRTFGWHFPRGINIYERDWDTLVILDACRVDLMQEVADEYPFMSEIDLIESIGSMSEEWMRKTFTDEYVDEMERTAYITANVFSEDVLDEERFDTLDEVWRYAWDDETGTIPPRPVTDRAIHTARNQNPDRLIVHYMQPHHPFVGKERLDIVDANPFGRNEGTTAVDALRRGDVSYETFWRVYRSNLETVLEDVSILLNNHNADRVVLTSDHGDALGEWGIYDHPAGCLHPVVKNVPWVETTATNEETYEPDTEPDSVTEVDVKGRLRNLGYV